MTPRSCAPTSRTLRRKIERGDGVRLIRTEHRVGYRFAEPPPQPEPLRHLRAA